MARSQKVIPIKLNKEQIAVLDAIVDLGEFNGRSHAIRELVIPALEAGRVAINESVGGKAKALFKYGTSMKNLSDRMEKIHDNAKQLPRDSKGQATIPLSDTHEELFPKIITA